MTTPRSTYRVQLRQGIDFAAIGAAVGYFADLGVTHVYLSPILRAAPASTHGYDAVSFDEIDPELGGTEGFENLVQSARFAGLGLILDFVPNHMSASIENRWLRDVLERGAKSEFAQHFDIDWTAPKLLLPILGEAYGSALEEGRLGVAFDSRHTSFVMTYGELRVPLAPPSYSRILARMGHDAALSVARQFAADDGRGGTATPALFELASDPAFRQAADEACAALSLDRDALHELLEAQVWRVAYWRLGREGLTYRRFFEIVDLIGVAVERPAVFTAAHGLVAELVREGKLDGLRLDHIDGLAEPKLYLERLRQLIGDEHRRYLVVEKILAQGETLRAWPVAGTTGYEFIAAIAGLLVDARGEKPIAEAYASFVGEVRSFEDLSRSTKRLILTRNLAGELDRLRDLALAVASADRATRDFGGDSLRRAIVELAAAMPVYRTYVSVEGPSEDDRAVIASAISGATATRQVEDEAVVAFLGRLLLLDFATPELQVAALQFATRFQQTSGPVMAKAVEDTAFYRWNRLVALNEVGGDPVRFGGSVDAFHAAMAERLERQPDGLTPLATHDTKRGADARARLYTLSEAPELWREAVTDLRGRLSGEADPDTEWLFFQSLLGAWPFDLDPADGAGAAALRERMQAYLLKALREGKERTSWGAPDSAHEERASSGTTAIIDDPAFRAEFVGRVAPFVIAGALNSLAQLAIQLVAPGVPDVYQGNEGWDLSLVDPDNRRPVDFAAAATTLGSVREATAEDLVARWRSGAIKARLLHDGLQLRRRLPDVFARGSYEPIAVAGAEAEHVAAFARRSGAISAIVVVPRLPFRLLLGAGEPLIPPDRWADTRVRLDDYGALRDVVTGAEWRGEVQVAELLDRFPVAVLEGIG